MTYVIHFSISTLLVYCGNKKSFDPQVDRYFPFIYVLEKRSSLFYFFYVEPFFTILKESTYY